VFLIMFKTGHALPLVVTRILRPRMSRGGSAERPREVCSSWPRTRQIRDLDSAVNRAPAQTFRVRELSVSAFSPRQQLCPRTLRVQAQAAASSGREQAAAEDAECPQSVRGRGFSTSAHWLRSRSVRKHGLAKNCPPRYVAVSMLPPVNFRVHVHIIPCHVVI